MKWSLTLSRKENEQATQELKILKEEIAAAYNFLRANRKSYFQGKKKIPIYLILGPSRFGKSTILSQAGLDLIDTEHKTMGDVTTTKYCSFWFTKEGIYIDTAGTYTKPEVARPRNDLIWRGFIKLLQKYFGKNSIAGTLIVLDLPAIVQDKNLLRKSLYCIRERVYEMASLIKTLHTHIIFTKCDRILGFTEFFSLLDTEERRQPFGISFANNNKIDLIPTFEIKFNRLLKHLNNRVIGNLQKSIHPEERALIKTFPSQMDQLRQIFIDVISKIPHGHHITLSGMYFTSSIQAGAPIDPIKAALFQALNLKEKVTYNLEFGDDRSYFIEEIFKTTINLPKHQKPTNFKFPWLRIEHIGVILIVVLVAGISGFIAYKSYQKNIAVMDQIKLSLAEQNLGEPNELYAAINQLKQNSESSVWLTLGINKTKKLYRSLTKTHQVLLVQNLSSQLETYLNTVNNTQEPIDSQKLYRSLRVYLMFGTPEKLDPSYVKSWYNDYGPENLDPQQKNNMQKQLATALQHKFKIALNQTLITSIRNTLNNLSPAQIIYLLLENNYAKKSLGLGTEATISTMYLGENFHKIYNSSIPNFITHLPQYDEVLGELKLFNKIESDPNIIKNIQDLYLEKYALAWANTLKPETPIEFKNLPEAAAPLISLLKQIRLGSKVNNAPEKLVRELNAKLPGLDTINLEDLQNNLNKLASYIETIAKSNDLNKSAFTATVKWVQEGETNNPLTTFKTFINTQPIWLQTYLQTIATNVYQALIDAAYDHINQVWDHTIMPKYNAVLANKYPLFKDSKQDLSLNDFNQFFGPRGLMDNFFNNYLKPFVNTDKTTWTWKNIDGQQINFSSTYLEVFLRAALIQKMFYSRKTTDPKLEFALTPREMSPNTISFTLHIDGQKITSTIEDKEIKHLVWPGPQPGTVTMSFVDNQGKYFTASEFGPWAWFRILDRANVTSNSNTKHFELTFDLNGNAAKYILSTTESVNPFIPEIISNFRCVEINLSDDK